MDDFDFTGTGESSFVGESISWIARIGTIRNSSMSNRGIAATPAKVIDMETHVNW
jgi:hypothetical protein